MGLNKSKGNMYEFITHSWNPVKGKCYHDCLYCYMKQWGEQKPIRFDEKELKTNLGAGNFIFVGSSCDLFADNIHGEWIDLTLNHCKKFKNEYLFQTKNPGRIVEEDLPEKSVICTTIETNRVYPEIMNNCISPHARALAMSQKKLDKYVTIEPIMDFDLEELLELIRMCNPKQVNVGADSCNHGLPEPDGEKTVQLIEGLMEFTTVHKKQNLSRIMNL